ncbi:3'(2'),5'-bisphosphate nucleotidase CysQ [Flavobacteriaceae bacterium]|nr:3'(2'),5'-bisphosphate nucleotidase CysQ [Flavobacteriaceae bacterium]
MDSIFKIAIDAALKAGERILEIYHQDFEVDFKQDDSPLTIADTSAHKIITSFLTETKFPILSEEGDAINYENRKNWKQFWLVDPLDGTKEFVKKNGEFTVNIALIEDGIPVFGVVFAPVIHKLYYGGTTVKPHLIHKEVIIPLKPANTNTAQYIVASKSHLNKETQDFINQYPDYGTISMGSSLKFMLLAEQKASLYPRIAPTMEWDTGAAHGVLKSLNYSVCDLQGNELIYNKENLLNPFFIAK